MPVYIPTKPTGFDYTRLINIHNHSAVKCYPALADGIPVAGGAGAWTLSAAFTEIVPANTIHDDFDIHYITIEGASDDEVYEVVLYAATTEIGRLRFATVTVANGMLLPPMPFQTEIIAAETQIQAKVASKGGGGDIVTMSILYHNY